VAIDDKPAARWTEDDLSELCRQHRRETARLEFKRELKLDTRDEKFEAERDAHGMANAGGGYIIYGIAEAELDDGATAASHLTPLMDGSLYERLNNVLDSRGEPRLPFDIHSLVAAAGGSYLVVEIFGHHRPHRCSNGRYYVRRNLLVREMTEAEIAEAYRDRFTRQAAALGVPELEPEPGRAEEARREQRELLRREFGLYRAETGADTDPGWLSVLAIPTEAEGGTVIDPVLIDAAQLHEASEHLQNRWRPEEAPLTHYRLQRTTRGFYGQLPDRDDTYPRYLVRFWRNGVAEFGDLLEPMFPTDDETQRRVIPSAAIVEYTHDFLLLVQQVYRLVGYGGAVEAEARLENVAGYRLAVRPGYDLPNLRSIQQDHLAPDPWRGTVDGLDQGAATVAHDLADLTFLAAGGGRPYFFQDGQYIRRG
jgi:hypothetical protein